MLFMMIDDKDSSLLFSSLELQDVVAHCFGFMTCGLEVTNYSYLEQCLSHFWVLVLSLAFFCPSFYLCLQGTPPMVHIKVCSQVF